MRVSNMTSSSGNKIANQFVIKTDEGRYFQSYESVIAFIPFDREESFYKLNKGSLNDNNLSEYPQLYLDKNDWDYSVTTGKYRNLFLGENKKETEKAIKDKRYMLIELNNN